MMLTKRKHFGQKLLEFVVVSETPLAEDYVAVEVSPRKDAETCIKTVLWQKNLLKSIARK